VEAVALGFDGFHLMIEMAVFCGVCSLPWSR
jgi:hypothetical protein